LRRADVVEVVERELLQDDGAQFQLQSWVLMPNHVHLVVDVWEVPLSTLINRWKGRSSRLANRVLGRKGAFWQEDYFDTLIRDEEHLQKAKRYAERNPVKAALVKSARDWKWSSARRRDEYERLPWQIKP
jgi:REP element-mobilizing transposase RayT